MTRPGTTTIATHSVFVIARSDSDVAICSRHKHLENTIGQFETYHELAQMPYKTKHFPADCHGRKRPRNDMDVSAYEVESARWGSEAGER